MSQSTLLKPKVIAEPFLKWAGGKRQLLSQITARLPSDLMQNRVTKYCEPFVGSGAVFFFLTQRFRFARVRICDVNPDLMLAYSTVRDDVVALVDQLRALEDWYLSLGPSERQNYYYQVREQFNLNRSAAELHHSDERRVTRTAQLIFLNRTCFNGLYRVNSKGDFNVPFGGYAYPRICDAENLAAVSRALQGVELVQGDFMACDDFIDSDTFVYFDPPYRPLTVSSSFTSYARNGFDDNEQLRLAHYFQTLNGRHARLMLSNSDPQTANPADEFLTRAYAGFHIGRVSASRAINSDARKRGKITELLITNY